MFVLRSIQKKNPETKRNKNSMGLRVSEKLPYYLGCDECRLLLRGSSSWLHSIHCEGFSESHR